MCIASACLTTSCAASSGSCFSKMKTIPLTHGKFTIVDDEDYEILSRHKWFFLNRGYAARYKKRHERETSKKVLVLMHRFIMGAPPGLEVDHRDGQKLLNARFNLRICTHRSNVINKCINKIHISGLKGAHWHKQHGYYTSSIYVDGKHVHLGCFETAQQAHEAYCAKARVLHGEFYREC